MRLLTLVFTLVPFCACDPQLDLPPLNQGSSTPRYYGLSSTPSINAPGNQYGVSQNPYNQFSTNRNSATPGVYPVSSTPGYDRGISPAVNNHGYPNLDYANGRIPSSSARPYDGRSDDDRIDVNNDPNFRRNDPNFLSSDPNYVGANPFDLNRGLTNSIDDRFHQVNLQQVRDFLLQADDQASKECTNNVAAQWNFETNVNDATQHAAVSTLL